MILNLPDPARAPVLRELARELGSAAVLEAATHAGMLYNAALDQALLHVSGLPGLQLIRLNIAAVFDHIVETAGDGDLRNTTESCLGKYVICTHPNRYLFWDGAHPTKAGHRLIAEAVLRLLDDDSHDDSHEARGSR